MLNCQDGARDNRQTVPWWPCARGSCKGRTVWGMASSRLERLVGVDAKKCAAVVCSSPSTKTWQRWYFSTRCVPPKMPWAWKLDSPRGWFRVLKVASKVWVLKWTQSTMLSRVTLMTILSEFIVWWMLKSIMPIVCRMPESILWLFLQVCWQTTECLVSQFVPITSVSRPFVSKLAIILRLIQVLPDWIDDHPSKDLKLWKTALFLLASLPFLSTHFRACPSTS